MFNVFDPAQKYISGPYNAIRMEGEIDGQSKVVYMFMDTHKPLQMQQECANVYSQDFNRYLAATFHDLNGSDRMYDFFMEIDENEYKTDTASRAGVIAKQPRYRPRSIYLQQVRELLMSTIEYNKENNQTSMSKVFQNVRLHYLDIREVLADMMMAIGHLPVSCNMDVRYVPSILHTLQRIREDIVYYLGIYTELKANPGSQSEAAKSKFGRNVHKLLYDYKHSNVKRVISARADRYFGELKKFISMIDEFAKLLEDYEHFVDTSTVTFIGDNGFFSGMSVEDRVRWGGNITLGHDKLFFLILTAGAGITDSYLLRRVLDKDYVTNAITYTGGAHTINYINVMAADFGFKVTHVSATRARSISELNRLIEQRLSKGERITDLFVLDHRSQCSNITNFPPRFL